MCIRGSASGFHEFLTVVVAVSVKRGILNWPEGDPGPREDDLLIAN